MTEDEHIQRHIEECRRQYEQLVKEGKWPWADFANSDDVVESGHEPNPIQETALDGLERLGLVLKAILAD